MKFFLKSLTSVAGAAIFLAMVPGAQAASTSSGFNVTVNLSGLCQIQSISDVAFSYSSFQTSVANSTGGAVSVRCTNNLGYSLALDATSGAVIGLNYTLGLSGTTGTGNGATQGFTISGTMAAGQSGNCATAGGSCSGTDNTRTLTVTY
jgi:hypothetical protein